MCKSVDDRRWCQDVKPKQTKQSLRVAWCAVATPSTGVRLMSAGGGGTDTWRRDAALVRLSVRTQDARVWDAGYGIRSDCRLQRREEVRQGAHPQSPTITRTHNTYPHLHSQAFTHTHPHSHSPVLTSLIRTHTRPYSHSPVPALTHTHPHSQASPAGTHRHHTRSPAITRTHMPHPHPHSQAQTPTFTLTDLTQTHTDPHSRPHQDPLRGLSVWVTVWYGL